MFVLQNVGGSFAIAVPESKGFNYSEDVRDASQWPNSRQAMKALTERAVHFARQNPKSTIAEDEFYLVEVTNVPPPVPVSPTFIVRVL